MKICVGIIQMKIEQINEENLDFIQAICLDPSIGTKLQNRMQNAMKKRINWIMRMIEKGLLIYVALEKPRDEIIHYKWYGKINHSDLAVNDWVPMGLIEAIPIEHALAPVNGEDILHIHCIWVLPVFWNSRVTSELMLKLLLKAKKECRFNRPVQKAAGA